MQRFLALLLVFVLLTGVLMGCTPNEQLDNPTTNKIQPTTQNMVPDTNPTTQPPTDPTDPTEPTQPPEPPEPDFFTRYGQDVPDAGQIPGYAQETDTPNLYSLPLDMPKMDVLRQIMTCGNVLYISYWHEFDQMPESCGIRAIDLETGTTMYDVTYPDWSDFGYLDGGGLWFYDYGNELLHLYDAIGQQTTVSLSLSAENPDAYISDICIDPTGEYLVCLYDAEVSVMLYNMKTGAVTTPNLPQSVQIYSVQYQQGQFYLSNYNDRIYLLDPATAECTQQSITVAFDDIRDGICYEMHNGGLVLSGIDGDPTRYYLKTELNLWISDLSHGCVALNSYGEGPQVHVLDLRNERYLADISFSEDCYTTFPLFLDNGCLLIIAASNDGYTAYLYDTASVPVDAEPLEAYQCTQEELEVQTAQMAQDILDSTGIELLYGSQGNDFAISDYVGAAELDTFKVFCAVDTVADILNRYPEGMLREAWDVGYNGLQIYLCGSIYGVYSGGLDMAGGVTSEANNYIIVAVDINNPIESVLPHELSHVFDHRINYMWEEMDWMAVWESIHPFSDAYIYSYDEYFAYTDYTPVGEKNPDDVWFVSSYGRTFPTEDRATIMEILWNSAEAPDPLLEYEHIMAKAKLYCYILRQCFPSCDTEEGPFWEQFLGIIDESVLP